MTRKSKLIWLIVGMVAGASSAYLAALFFDTWGIAALFILFCVFLTFVRISKPRTIPH